MENITKNICKISRQRQDNHNDYYFYPKEDGLFKKEAFEDKLVIVKIFDINNQIIDDFEISVSVKWKSDISTQIRTTTRNGVDVSKKYNNSTIIAFPKRYLENFSINDFLVKTTNDNQNKQYDTKSPKNQILYGPPGTGKTYNTVVEAIKILNKSLYDEYISEQQTKTYNDLKTEFNKLKEEGRIEFITFHQSYSYEEFVEGIKPDLKRKNTKNVNYVLKNGVFKNICEHAIKMPYSEIPFDYLYDKFKEKYPVGSSFKTTHPERSDGPFSIMEYLDDGFKINKNSDNNPKLTKNNLEKCFNENCSSLEETKNITGDKNSYYYPILLILKDLENELKESKQAKELKKEPCVLIIDEINRGNISKIFGELITLIEEDKRLGEKHALTITLPYSQDTFGVPSNLYIIGTMNTSDRSIASVDIALRRRFKFKEIMPDLTLIKDFEDKGNSIALNKIIETLNKRISALLDRDHQIGHSYFIEVKDITITTLKQVWFDSVMPLLNEYFYGDWEKLQLILGEAQGENECSFIEKFKTDNIFAKCGSDISYDDDKYFDFRKKSVFDNKKFLNALSHAFPETISESDKQE